MNAHSIDAATRWSLRLRLRTFCWVVAAIAVATASLKYAYLAKLRYFENLVTYHEWRDRDYWENVQIEMLLKQQSGDKSAASASKASSDFHRVHALRAADEVEEIKRDGLVSLFRVGTKERLPIDSPVEPHMRVVFEAQNYYANYGIHKHGYAFELLYAAVACLGAIIIILRAIRQKPAA